MNTLGIDIGSSSVKAALLTGSRILSAVTRVPFDTKFTGVRAEVDPATVLKSIAKAIDVIGPRAKHVDVIALSVMSPSWIAMDARGRAITPIVTHQDRRSVPEAQSIEQRVGLRRHLKLAGNRPFPGGISSTTCAWYFRHEPQLMKRADLVGHLNTFLHRQMTGARAVDPSHASFMGFYLTLTLGGWSDELCEAAGVPPAILPEVLESNRIAGHVTAAAAERFGLGASTPMMTGMVDTGAAMVLAGARTGQLVNVSGSTDVLMACTERPVPHERLLTRALGVERKWTSVSTLAAAGSSLTWMRERMFADWSEKKFWSLVVRLAGSRIESGVTFEPYLAGDRMSIDQRRGAFMGLTLSTTREEMLGAVIESLASASAARLPLLRESCHKISRDVLVSGGTQHGLSRVLYRDWPGDWRFKPEADATLRGLGLLTPIDRS